jgi:hypothetical protein
MMVKTAFPATELIAHAVLSAKRRRGSEEHLANKKGGDFDRRLPVWT